MIFRKLLIATEMKNTQMPLFTTTHRNCIVSGGLIMIAIFPVKRDKFLGRVEQIKSITHRAEIFQTCSDCIIIHPIFALQNVNKKCNIDYAYEKKNINKRMEKFFLKGTHTLNYIRFSLPLSSLTLMAVSFLFYDIIFIRQE